MIQINAKLYLVFKKVNRMKIFSFIASMILSVNLYANTAASIEDLQRMIQIEGLTGLVHGADHEHGFYTFTWNHPQDFFNRFHLSMTTQKSEVKAMFANIERGDKVWVKGDLPIEKGQPHLDIFEMKIIQKYNPTMEAPAGEFERKVILPDDLLNKSEIEVMVHAVEAQGRVLVLEYADTIIPMIVTRPELSKDLFRGDWIKVKYVVKQSEESDRPTHLQLDVKNTTPETPPLTIIDKISRLNGQEVNYEGRLVLFPKSPTINMDVWAVEQLGPMGANRYFTLVNFKPNDNGEMEELNKIGTKLKSQWDLFPQGVSKGRNKYIHTQLRVRANGKVTIIDQGQANAQIHLTSDNIEVIHP